MRIDFDHRIAHIKDSKNGRPRRVGLVDSVIQELEKLETIPKPRGKKATGICEQNSFWKSRHQEGMACCVKTGKH